jgi:hypothetical protein
MKSLLLCVILSVVQGQTDILLPDTVKADVGAFIPITAQTKGDVVRFVALDPGLNVFPANLLADKKSTVVTASKAGRFRVLAYTSINNVATAPAFTTVIVGNSPDPSPPEPNPGPKPPEPMPNDQFAESIKGMFGGLQEPDKVDSAKKLAHVYELAVLECDNQQYKTLGQLYNTVRSLSFQNIKADKINPIREAIANELDSILGTDPNAVFDENLKKKCKTQFSRMQKILGGLNG